MLLYLGKQQHTELCGADMGFQFSSCDARHCDSHDNHAIYQHAQNIVVESLNIVIRTEQSTSGQQLNQKGIRLFFANILKVGTFFTCNKDVSKASKHQVMKRIYF